MLLTGKPLRGGEAAAEARGDDGGGELPSLITDALVPLRRTTVTSGDIDTPSFPRLRKELPCHVRWYAEATADGTLPSAGLGEATPPSLVPLVGLSLKLRSLHRVT